MQSSLRFIAEVLMKVNSTNFLFGIFLIILGVFFILSTAFDFRLEDAYIVALVFFSLGVVLLLAYFIFQNKLWTLITGIASLFIASAVYVHESQVLPDDAIGALLFVLIGLAFLTALRGGKKNWWAIIPAGFSFMFAAHVIIDMSWWNADRYHGVVFFAGVGVIFGIIYLLKDKTYELDWAKYPSIIAFIFAVLVLFTVEAGEYLGRLILPLILMGIGALIIRKALRDAERKQTAEEEAAPEDTPVKSPPKKSPRSKS